MIAFAVLAVLATTTAPRLSVETDPLTFAFSGHAAHARATLPDLPYLTVGAGIYGMDFPDLLVNLDEKNANDGWSVRLDQGYALFLDAYPLGGAPDGLVLGVQLAMQRFTVAKDGGHAQFWNALAMPRLGFQWHVMGSGSGLYLFPWIALGFTAPVLGTREVVDDSYSVSPFVPFGALHVGYTF